MRHLFCFLYILFYNRTINSLFNLQIMQKQTAKIGIRTTPALKAQWQKEAKERGLTLSAYITDKMGDVEGVKHIDHLFYNTIYNTDGTTTDSVYTRIKFFAMYASENNLKGVTIDLGEEHAAHLLNFFNAFSREFLFRNPEVLKEVRKEKVILTSSDMLAKTK